jgi:hypothetical protein
MIPRMLSPRSTEPLDQLLMPSGTHLPMGVLACFDPVLPPQASCDPATWTALRVRRDERWREHHGPIGDALRALAADGIIRFGADGVLCDPRNGEPLTELPDVTAIDHDGR